MKKLSLILVMLTSLTLSAGDKVGNGGGLWTCTVNNNLQFGFLVDLYEAQEEFGLSLMSSYETDPVKIVQERSDYVRLNVPKYSVKWNQYLSEVTSKIRMVNSELVIVDDALFRIKPSRSTCRSEWAYVQFANFTNQDQILIRKDLWQNSYIEPIHKAALIWHEVIYKWLREEYKDKDSVRARQIVGYLFSNLPAHQMTLKIDSVLGDRFPPPKQWMCLVNNSHISMYYADYGSSQLEAKTKTLQKCQNGQSGFFCDESSLKCEEIISGEWSFTCQAKNSHISQVYLGKGRNKLEAEFKAREACQSTNHKYFCESQVTCE